MVEYAVDGTLAAECDLRYGRPVRSSYMLKPLIIAALAVTAASPVLAEVGTTTTSNTDKAKDPNRKICEKVERIGSRVSVVRICMTAAQWEEQKRENREHLERVQRVVNQTPSN